MCLHHPPASGDPAVCYSLFPCELSSAVRFHYPWHQGKGVVTARISANLVLPSPGVQMADAPRYHPRSSSSTFFRKKSVHLKKIHLTQHLPRGICILCRPGLATPGTRSPCSCNIHSQISLASLWRYVSHLVPLQSGGHSI